MKKIPIKRMIAIAAFLALFILIVIFSGIYTEYIELREVGERFTEVFWRDFNVGVITFGIAFLVFFTLILSNLLIMRRNLLAIDSSFFYLKKVFPLVLISLVTGVIFADYTRRMVAAKFLPFLTSEWFNLGDPIFHKDVGYYIFQRPFYISVTNTLLAFGVFFMLFTALSYIVLYARFDFYNSKQLLKEKGIIVHQITTIIIYFLLKAASYRYAAEDILYDSGNEFTGGGYVDINVWVQFYRILPILLISIVILTIIFTLNSKYRYAVMTVLLYPTAILVVMLIAQTVQTLIVDPDEFAVEAAYMQSNIDFTRAAYGLDKIENYDFKVKYDLNGQDIMKNLDTVNNIRLIDYAQTVATANRIQSIRNYYHFTDTDIVPYVIGDRPMAVAIAAREITTERLDDTAKNYINTKMKYTHGTGVVMNPINRITEQGQPYFIIRDIPPRSLEGAPTISQPRIYYGETSRDYIITGTRDKELDEIETEGYTYTGSGGIRLSFLNKLIYAFKHGDINLLISDQISRDSRLLKNRNVLERVKMVAPFLSFESDIYILIDDFGRLKWVVDGYTSSSWFPYSQYSGSGDINYIRNSVKAVVDAYDGEVKFYVTDEGDPIIRSYRRIYPTLFEQSAFPSDLARHIRYPEGIFKIQSEMLKRYHVDNSADFYEKRGIWAYAKEKYMGEEEVYVEPYYNLMKVGGGKSEELVLMQPYTLLNKTNMVSWLAARSSPENYGKLVCYNFGNNENVYGPYDIENKIDNEPSIAQELALWNRSGSEVVRGNLLVIPIENSILYVEPIYISAGTEYGRLPEVKRIVVAYGERVVSKPTLDEALKTLFGVNRPTLVTTNEESLEDVINRVVDSFNDVKAFSKDADWENYGKALRELEDNIQSLKEKNEENAQIRKANETISDENSQIGEIPLTRQ
ncbi:MAG: hypothetical protein BWY15_00483 [Firmicutes bacterium ADurb.Bin193]|nr:MAG: hypothetical protein BWY15_00483 [Firmicutes bacterium ADurb.Bin193]